jgi:hypothetical protein
MNAIMYFANNAITPSITNVLLAGLFSASDIIKSRPDSKDCNKNLSSALIALSPTNKYIFISKFYNLGLYLFVKTRYTSCINQIDER